MSNRSAVRENSPSDCLLQIYRQTFIPGDFPKFITQPFSSIIFM